MRTKWICFPNTISEISEYCGFSDYAHFSRVFAKYACVSPAKFRKDKQ